MRTLELLAPAKNLECGKAAILHGADAVYIGAPKFGARQAAGNSLDDIKELCVYAHQYGAHVHVTVNTIIYENELEDTLKMISDLDNIGVDALLLQDMGVYSEVRKRGLWHRELHASTQCDTRSSHKVKWLKRIGFNRAVLARELSSDEISEIHNNVPDMNLEVFVHGALCVSYSGECYASQYCFGRSANRGECAQFCRMKFDLLDDDNNEVEHQRYLLSLKDMCQINNLELLADSGACSFKIEGRLKDVEYIKNVVSAYSQQLDKIIEKRKNEYCRASIGRVTYSFTPDLKKTFNRGFTSYFLKGRQPDIASFDTPKAIGEYVGKVKELRHDSFNVAGTASFSNGDGLCFINDEHELEGFRVNRAVGNRLYPLRISEHLRPGIALYRNNDEAFSKILSGETAERKIQIIMNFSLTENGFRLEAFNDETGIRGKSEIVFEHQPAKKPQHDNIVKQLEKLGNTIYELKIINIAEEADKYFIPSSLLSDLRRSCIESLSSLSKMQLNTAPIEKISSSDNIRDIVPSIYKTWGYLYNISNSKAKEFYQTQELKNPQMAFEVVPIDNPVIMQCRHCIRYSLGFCVKRGGNKPTWKEPLKLRLGDGRLFRLEFNCKDCQMNIYAE